MKRLATVTLALLGLTLLGCASSGGPGPRNVPPGCTSTGNASFTVRVDASGHPTPDCLAIYPGTTSITWQGPADARRLLVVFNRGTRPAPQDPGCSGPRCTLGRSASRGEGEFKYSVVLVPADGHPVTVDPMLIIQP
jgi:hypothetical protein